MEYEGLPTKGRYVRIPISLIERATYNPRISLKKGSPEYEALRRSIEMNGIVDPLIWNERTGVLVGGHQRLTVLEDMGETEVDVSVVNLEENQEKTLNIQLNKIQGNWDVQKLEELLTDLSNSLVDLTLTGFSEEEIDDLFNGFAVPDEGGEAGTFEGTGEQVPDFAPVDENNIPRLDKKTHIECPECGAHFDSAKAKRVFPDDENGSSEHGSGTFEE